MKGVYLDQLVKIEDITEHVQQYIKKDSLPSHKLQARSQIYDLLKKEYSQKDGWQDLMLEPVEFYNGGKYALYGFKRYRDVRLVFMPELSLAFFGGDYDNFTYPRYDLDCSFFRVYDENGKPLKTTNYFQFSTTQVNENDPVFIIGNPARTIRLSSIADLEFRRDLVLPIMIRLIKGNSLVIEESNKNLKKDSLIVVRLGLENGFKRYQGELDGLKNAYIFGRKEAFEKKFRTDAVQLNKDNSLLWDKLEAADELLRKIYTDYFLFNPSSRYNGRLYRFASELANYLWLKRKHLPEADSTLKRLNRFFPTETTEISKGELAVFLKETAQYLGPKDSIVTSMIQGSSYAEIAENILQKSKLIIPPVRMELLKGDTNQIFGSWSDPLLNLAKALVERYYRIEKQYNAIQSQIFALHSQMGNLLFQLYGTAIPPDATFSLRITDGLVSGYTYNETRTFPL